MCRFADAELTEFYEKFKDHVKEEDAYRKRTDKFMHESLQDRRVHTETIKKLSDQAHRLTEQTERHISSTQELITLYKNYTVGKKLISFLGKSIISVAAFLALFLSLAHYLKEHGLI